MALQWGHDNGVVERAGAGCRSTRRKTCFNGATTMESWKGACRRHNNPVLPASMGPRQWSRGKAFAERHRSATSLRDIARASMGPRQWSRGKDLTRKQAKVQSLASMGPRQWSRGKAPSRRRRRRNMQSFNGATTMESWKGSARLLEQRPFDALQWGHDNGVVERPWPSAFLPAGCNRFNGATTMESWKGP